MNDDRVTAADPDTGEIEDITPGSGPAALLHDPADEFEYQDATGTWVGEPARVEIRIDAIDGATKRFLLVEPSDNTMDQLIAAVLDDDERAFCAGVVESPELTSHRWREEMTGRERKLLYDSAFSWLHFGDFVSIQRRI